MESISKEIITAREQGEKDFLLFMKQYIVVLEKALQESIKKRTRKREMVEKRQVMMYMLKDVGFSIMEIAKATGYSHANVIYAIRKVEERISIIDRLTINQINECRWDINFKSRHYLKFKGTGPDDSVENQIEPFFSTN